VVDGLGHGPEAAVVANAATEYFAKVPLDVEMSLLMRDLHAALAGTRGAAGTVCVLRDGRIEVCAVGNVELRSDLRIPLVSSAGVLGVRVVRFHTCAVALRGGVRMALFSDGISPRVGLDDVRRLTPTAACEAIMRTHRRREDDATILIADVE
jgi:negative regulator of sigma-B (phosphoserine phosphatase)